MIGSHTLNFIFLEQGKFLQTLDERLPTFYRKREEWDPDGIVDNILSIST